MYQIKIEKFEGPLDLLLSLIEERKMDIARISLAEVTDQYIQYIRQAREIRLENLADFLSVAAKLILIKSKSLLPSLQLDDEEEEEIKDLEYQLKEYKKFKVAAAMLGEMLGQKKISFSFYGMRSVTSAFNVPQNVTLNSLAQSFQAVLGEIPLKEKLEEEVVKDVVTLEEKIDNLLSKLKEKAEVSFANIVNNAEDKTDVIVSFLAVLEMVKQCVVDVRQQEMFAEITVSSV